jgi:hypothetical protein
MKVIQLRWIAFMEREASWTVGVSILFFKCPTFYKRKVSLDNLPFRYNKNFSTNALCPPFKYLVLEGTCQGDSC